MVVRIKEGGTGQVTAPGARIALGLSDQNIIDIVAGGGPPGPYQPIDADLTAIAALTTTGYGRGFLTLADAAGGRTYLGLGTMATETASNYLTTATAATTYLPLTGGTLTGNLNIDADMMIRGAAGTSRFMSFVTGTSTRWLINADNTAEGGANAGSDFAIYRYDDVGAFLGQPLYIQRSTGDVFLERHLSVPGTLDVTQDVTVIGDVIAENVAATNVLGTNVSGSGTGLTALNASNLASGTIPDARLPARIATDGQFIFPSVQNPSTNVNTLDDYEEGTWTPAIAFSGASVGVTYTSRPAFYVKIGQFVSVWADITLSNKGSSTGTAQVSGLPFTAVSVTGFGVVAYILPTVGLPSAITASAASTGIDLRTWTGTGTGSVNETHFANNTRIIVGATYKTT